MTKLRGKYARIFAISVEENTQIFVSDTDFPMQKRKNLPQKLESDEEKR
jgi:hypothetical protein